MLSNAITNGSGTWKVFSKYPPHVLIALPLRENLALSNMALVEMCLAEIRLEYPRIKSIVASIEDTKENGKVLQLIAKGV